MQTKGIIPRSLDLKPGSPFEFRAMPGLAWHKCRNEELVVAHSQGASAAFHKPLPESILGLGDGICTRFPLRMINHVVLLPTVSEKEVESHGNDDS